MPQMVQGKRPKVLVPSHLANIACSAPAC